MQKDIARKFDTFQFHRGLLVGFLKSLTNRQLTTSVGRGMGTIGMQFRHIGEIERCYSEALTTGKMDFSKQTRNSSLESSKGALLDFLASSDKRLRDLLEDLSGSQLENSRIDWTNTHQKNPSLTVLEHLEWLIEHEILHEGELVVYARVLGLSFPLSWKVWGL